MSIAKQGLPLIRQLDAWRQLELIAAIIHWLASLFAMSGAVFTRRRFGKRYLSWLNLAFGYTAVVNFAIFGNVVVGMAGGEPSMLMVGAWLTFVAASIFHRWVIARRERKGEVWHTYFHGQSLIPGPFSDEVKVKWIEPGLFIGLGIFCWPLSHLFALWLLLTGVSLWVYTHLAYYFREQDVLDMVDAQIEARNMQAALAGRPASETQGFTMAQSLRRTINSDPGIAAAVAGLSPELKALMTEGPARRPNGAAERATSAAA